MKDELKIRIGNAEKKCILGNGFYSSAMPTHNLHKHNYAEIHIIAGGNACFKYENDTVSLSEGDIFIVPENKLHAFESYDENILHTAFLIESNCEKMLIKRQPKELLSFFFNEIVECEKTRNYAKISAYISLICCDFFPESSLEAQKITDHAFIINNFFSMNYTKDSNLSDLAAELHFSKKQTERLVLNHTGTTFKKAMIAYRMSMAKHLADTTDLSFADIAKRVGYNSYNGFWKAYSKSFGQNR
ncbi:MAG: AraC family transcriptional regulator [Clostridia bacterium]|nr:AraC family transcriptional regulator [Clostridia bacterium]